METNNNPNINVDELLQELQMEAQSTSSPTPPTPSADTASNTISSFSDEDIADILEENGFTEDIEDTDRQEYLSESGDIEASTNIEQQINESIEEHLDQHSSPVDDRTIEENEGEEEGGNNENSSEDTEPEDPTALPLNSPTLLIDEATTRFSGAEWFQEIQKAKIIVAGCGGIGSNLIFQLARMHPAKMVVYDDDTVNKVNMAGQLFGHQDLGRFKVNAIATTVAQFTNMSTLQAIPQKFLSDTESGDIMMCGFDNMRARKAFFNSWKTHVMAKPEEERAKCLYLDGRLSIDTLQILCIKGDDSYNIDRYGKEFLFTDSEAEPTVCSMKQTTYLACMIASLMTNLFTNFIAGTLDPIIPYDLPFFTEYNAQSMLFKTEN